MRSLSLAWRRSHGRTLCCQLPRRHARELQRRVCRCVPEGLPVGIGSGLLFTGKQGDTLTFATVTDRGPNADSPKVGKDEAKIFVTPDFAPLLMTIRVQNGKAEAVDARLCMR